MTGLSPAQRRAVLAAALAAFAVRAAYLLSAAPASRLTPDSTDYARAASNLARYGEFSLSERPPLVPDTVRTPGYPLFLAPFVGADALGAGAVVWAQAVLGAASAGLLAWAAALLWGGARTGLWAGLGLAADAASVFHTGFVLTETLFTACVTLLLFALARAQRAPRAGPGAWAAAGLACGAAALVRPVGLYLFVFAAAAAAFALRAARRPAARPVALFLAAALLLPGLWTLRNRVRTGVWTFTSIQGMNIFGMRAAAVEMVLSGAGYDEALARLKGRLAADYPDAAAAPEEEARRQGRFALRFLASHPLAYARVMARDSAKMLGGHAMELPAWTLLEDPAFDQMKPSGLPRPGGFLSGTRTLVERHPGLLLPAALYAAFLAAAYALAFWGFAAAWRGGQKGEAALAAFPAVYLLLVSAGAIAYYRLRIPLMPAVFLLAARGLSRRNS